MNSYGEDYFDWTYWCGNDTILNYTAGQDQIRFYGNGSLSGYEISGNDVVLHNTENSSTLTVKDIGVDDLTIIDIYGNELTEWKQPVSSSSYLAELPGESSESLIYRSEDRMANPTEDAMDLPVTFDKTIFREELERYGSLAINAGQKQGDLVGAR